MTALGWDVGGLAFRNAGGTLLLAQAGSRVGTKLGTTTWGEPLC
jgi:hypothetical protein